MLRRFQRHLNPSMVIATIALIAALSGGYAMAVSGDGRLHRDQIVGLPVTGEDRVNAVEVAELSGLGEILATCVQYRHGDSRSAVGLYFENQSGGPLNLQGTGAANFNARGYNILNRQDGRSVYLTEFFGGGAIDRNQPQGAMVDLHISPANGKLDPQANVNISVVADEKCAAARVAILSLDTGA